MTEIEKIAYAKGFIDKLANGINPLNDTAVPENDIMNNVRLSRCMFFVSDILRQVIENGGVSPKYSYVKKTPFFLTPEQRNRFSFSKYPISISEITKRLNELIEAENMKKITHNKITAWLVNSGFLDEYQTADNHTSKRPTELGNSIGISTEQREGQRGTYTAVLYNTNAQQFILDNLDAVMEFYAEMKRAKENDYQ